MKFIHMQGKRETGVNPVRTRQDVYKRQVFAKKHDLSIDKKEGIKKVSAKVLEKKKLSMAIAPEYAAKVDVAIGAPEDGQKPEALLTLTPKEYILGIGCRRNKEEQELKAFAESCLKEAGVDWKQIRAIASIDKKLSLIHICPYSLQEMPGILANW